MKTREQYLNFSCLLLFQSDTEIQRFVETTFHINFPLFAKIDVYGENAPASWQFLTGIIFFSFSFCEIQNYQKDLGLYLVISSMLK